MRDITVYIRCIHTTLTYSTRASSIHVVTISSSSATTTTSAASAAATVAWTPVTCAVMLHCSMKVLQQANINMEHSEKAIVTAVIYYCAICAVPFFFSNKNIIYTFYQSLKCMKKHLTCLLCCVLGIQSLLKWNKTNFKIR